MPTDITDNLEPVEDDFEEFTNEELVDTEEEPEEEEKEEPNEIDSLKQEIERLKANERSIEDLKRSVGRIQSLETRLQQESTNRGAVANELNKQFSEVNDLLGALVSNLDETAIDPATKARLVQAYNDTKRAAETASLRKQTTEEVLESLRKQLPQLSQDQQAQTQGVSQEMVRQAQMIEEQVVEMFEDRNLNPDDPKFKGLWEDGAKLIRDGKTPREVRTFFRNGLKSTSDDGDATDRRQAAKNRAGKGSATGSAESTGDIYTGDLEKDIQNLRRMGVNV